ncbi:GntR family transcriptional regulator [Streptomyces sp. DSM 44917]|uniref:GntR family transcriptional regulator n=1 Tax=Streptomyces boetiae TaxID=3075541 RepID=A0ABU2L6Y4_9ACTN|nr:GntR family transcriptional regulator [Streptomyces sp. DSM 44917]MDT0307325.1 GntR family transcriptional regulator [Streptomyces sp. DSM 44917]
MTASHRTSVTDREGTRDVGKSLRRASVVDQLLDELRRSIITGALRPGQELAATRLAEEFDVSHIPVREALRSLANEGLVTLHSQRKARVAGIDVADVENVYRLRILIEGDLIERAASRYTDTHLAAFRELYERMGSTSSDEDLRTHDAFHRAMIEPAASVWDNRILDVLWNASERHLRILFAAFEPGDAQYEHDQLLGRALDRDGPGLREALTTHLERGLRLLSERARAYAPAPDGTPSAGTP